MKKFLIGLSVLLVLLFSGGCASKFKINTIVKTEAEKGCALNDGEHCDDLGWLYFHGRADTKQNYLKAEKYLKKSCNLNCAWGCQTLGLLYWMREDGKKDYLKRNKYYQKSCDLNSSEACHVLGNSYSFGSYGVKQNYLKALKYYRKSCDLKLGKGCYSVGYLYEQGKIGAKPDYLKAIKYYRKSCDIAATGCHRIKYLKERMK